MKEVKLFLQTPSKWMEGSGPYAEIILSSRTRLARNLASFPFPSLMTESQRESVVERVVAAVKEQEVAAQFGEMEVLYVHKLSPLVRQALVEKHLISPEYAAAEGFRAFIRSTDEVLSIMVNEEDHLRVQCLYPALQLGESFRFADRFDDALEAKLDFAFDEKRGYLTACPTNVGTGLRASVMVHLPALALTGQADRVLAALSKVGLAVRGLYGEGSQALGNIFQVSNQVTLGQSEEEIVQNLSAVARQLVDQESSARAQLQKEAKLQLEDRVFRAYGILTSARVISSQEALNLLSELRLGIDLKLIKGIDGRVLNKLLVLLQPACTQVLAGREMGAFERDGARASLIREYLTGKF